MTWFVQVNDYAAYLYDGIAILAKLKASNTTTFDSHIREKIENLQFTGNTVHVLVKVLS